MDIDIDINIKMCKNCPYLEFVWFAFPKDTDQQKEQVFLLYF